MSRMTVNFIYGQISPDSSDLTDIFLSIKLMSPLKKWTQDYIIFRITR